MGAHETVDASEENLGEALRDLTGGAGVDVVVDFVCTAEGVEGGLRGLGKGGRFLAMGANRIERFPFLPGSCFARNSRSWAAATPPSRRSSTRSNS